SRACAHPVQYYCGSTEVVGIPDNRIPSSCIWIHLTVTTLVADGGGQWLFDYSMKLCCHNISSLGKKLDILSLYISKLRYTLMDSSNIALQHKWTSFPFTTLN
ncbi:MAG: hypothetical protein WAJ93_15790, partial [Candidatus Nitrosopolaris sp.]